MIDMNIGKRIKERRLELGLTQAQIYDHTHISSGNQSNIEKGKVLPSSSALISLSEILQCSIDYILKGESSISKDKSCFNFEDLSDQEKELLQNFNMLNQQDKIELLEITYLKIRLNNQKKKLLNSSLESSTASA